MATEPIITKHIVETPGTCGGKPRVTGTRIRVQDIVLWTEQGRSPDEIVTEYPQLTHGDVHAALTYYHDNRARIEEQIRDADGLVERLMADPKMRAPQGRDADGNQVSS
ncbi:MAG: DUF433 domain-containing protein [Pirellulaceae bacterium]|nr:DUF433 domain-containing protein [Pirellulaceae bacterium]